MEDQIDLLIEEPETWRGGVSWPVIASAIVHVVLIVWLVNSYHPVRNDDAAPPIARYVQLIRQNPQQEFTEAPGAKINAKPLNAPLSDANRKASMPEPTGPTPTTRPGDGSRAMYRPRSADGDANRSAAAQPQQAQAAQQQQQQSAAATAAQLQPQPSNSALTFRQPAQQAAAANAPVDLRSAIREVGKVASLGGRQGLDLGQLGGDKGSAEAGPLSFETAWYDWGEYAESMVSKIRVHWEDEMPRPLLQTGMKGVVTIRFTIHRDGSITEVNIINSSGIAPYDYAAKKAIELASPLKPLPPDFPKETEHVTAMFYYNSEPPRR